MRTLLQITRAEREIFLKNDYCARLKNKVRFCALRRIICNTPTAGVPTRDPNNCDSFQKQRLSIEMIDEAHRANTLRVTGART